MEKAKYDVAVSLMKEGFDIDYISRIAGVNKDKLLDLFNGNKVIH
jgi:hypothetical protein